MRVISQKGMPVMTDIPYEKVVISQSMIEPNEIVAWDFFSGEDTIILMAEYSTPEKAEKAMQKLHEAYAPDPLYIRKDVSPVERAAAGEISWAQALDEMHTGMFVQPIPNSSIEQVYTGNIVFRFPREDEL